MINFIRPLAPNFCDEACILGKSLVAVLFLLGFLFVVMERKHGGVFELYTECALIQLARAGRFVIHID